MRKELQDSMDVEKKLADFNEVKKVLAEAVDVVSDYALHGSDYDYGARASAFLVKHSSFIKRLKEVKG